MKKFFNTLIWIILTLLVLTILWFIFLPQTAIQFLPENRKDAVRTSLWCDTVVDTTDDLNKLESKLDIIINKVEGMHSQVNQMQTKINTTIQPTTETVTPPTREVEKIEEKPTTDTAAEEKETE